MPLLLFTLKTLAVNILKEKNTLYLFIYNALQNKEYNSENALFLHRK